MTFKQRTSCLKSEHIGLLCKEDEPVLFLGLFLHKMDGELHPLVNGIHQHTEAMEERVYRAKLSSEVSLEKLHCPQKSKDDPC